MYSVFVSTFHATRLVVPKWKIPSLNYFLDSLTKEKYKLIHMGVLNSSKGNDHALLVQRNKNVKSKQIVKKPKSEIEDDNLNPIDEDPVKKGKKKGRTSKCSSVFIHRRIISRIIWTSFLIFLISTISKFQKN